MEDIYTTTTETLYPSETSFDDVIVRVYGRTPSIDSDHPEFRQVTVRGFEPYFYTLKSEAQDVHQAEHKNLVRYEQVDTEPLADRFEDDVRTENLIKVVASYPGAVKGLRQKFDKTWEADCLFSERFRIDKEIRTGIRVPTESTRNGGEHIIVDADDVKPVELTEVEPRVVTLDIETDDRGEGFPAPGEARILSIVAHDSYTDEYTGWVDLDGRSLEEHFDIPNVVDDDVLDEINDPESERTLELDDLGLTELDSLNFEKTERRELISFGSWIQDTNPDLLCGWNSGDDSVDGFDFPQLIERMQAVGASPQRLSREGDVEVEEYDDDYTPFVTGRALYDLMDGWEDTKFTEPRSKKLDYAASVELNDAKIPHPEMGYYEMYRKEPIKFLNYNAKDTRLTVEVADEANVIGFKKRLKDIVGVDWRRTHENNEFIEMSIRRKCAEHGLAVITKYSNPHVIEAMKNPGGDGEVNYEGAHVEKAFKGVLENIVGVDLASLYPMTQWMLNASPDARIDRKRAWREDIPHVVAANGQAFRRDKDGIIRELVDEYHELKAKFKERRNNAEYGTDEWEEAAEAYNVLKTIYNSFYGYSGWDKSPLYNPHDAAAVTLTGQRVIKRTTGYISEQTQASVKYGDTDSNYIQLPPEWGQVKTLEYAEEMCETLTNEVYPDLCGKFNIPPEDNRWEIEVEMRAQRFFMHGKKKRYAYLKTWDEGDDFDSIVGVPDEAFKERDGWEITDPSQLPDCIKYGKFSATGYDCVKSDTALITKEAQEDILEPIVRGASKSEIANIAFEYATKIDARDPDWEYVGIPQGLRKGINKNKADSDDYYTWSKTGDHPQGENPRAAWFANHLLNTDIGQGSKPMRVKLKPGLRVKDEPVDVIAFDSEDDLEPIKDDLQIDVSETHRKTLKLPLENILDAFGIEPAAAFQGKTQEQSSLGAF